MSRPITRSKSWINIPDAKKDYLLRKVLHNCSDCQENNVTELNSACSKCNVIITALRRYADSNIPIRYWNLGMKEFKGPTQLADLYHDVSSDLTKAYHEGLCICLAGNNGCGKTTVFTNILKKAVQKGHTCLYVTLSDIVSNITTCPFEEKFNARKELLTVDFLVIDEFDPRYMPTEASADLFGRTLEDVFRKRSENLLPLLMATNSPNVIDSFHGPIRSSIESLMNYMTIIPVLGLDQRKAMKGGN